MIFFMNTFQEVESDSAEPVTPTKESSEDGPEEEPPSVPSSPSGVNRRTSVLFTKKAGALFKVRTKNGLLIFMLLVVETIFKIFAMFCIISTLFYDTICMSF